MTTPYTLVHNIAHRTEPPRDGTLSRTIYQDERLKAVLFDFSAGQELSEHTSSSPAVLHFLTGEAEVTRGPDHITTKIGTWIHMPAQLPHSIHATTSVSMLLLLLKQA